MHDGLLADTGVLVRTLELCQLVNVRARLRANLPFMRAAFHADDNAFAVDRIDNAGAFADHDGAGIARGHALHAGADKRRFGAQQRNGLPLHVRTHQRTVCVVVFKERNQAGRHRDELFRTDVHVLDLVSML